MANIRQTIDGSSPLDEVIALLEIVITDFSLEGGPRVQLCRDFLSKGIDMLFALRGSMHPTAVLTNCEILQLIDREIAIFQRRLKMAEEGGQTARLNFLNVENEGGALDALKLVRRHVVGEQREPR